MDCGFCKESVEHCICNLINGDGEDSTEKLKDIKVSAYCKRCGQHLTQCDCNFETTTKEENALDVQVGGNHYKNFKIQPVEFCQVNELNACESAIVKYACRHRNKNGIEDLKKIKHYVDLLIELEY